MKDEIIHTFHELVGEWNETVHLSQSEHISTFTRIEAIKCLFYRLDYKFKDFLLFGFIIKTFILVVTLCFESLTH